MTAISATSGNSYQSPLQQLQAQLQAEVNSGAVSSSDQDALSSALTDINSSLQSGGSSASAGGTKPSPADLQSKINDLIAGEVSSGKLTGDQATELQGIFKAAFADGGPAPGGAGGAHHGHHGGHGGQSPPAVRPRPTAPAPPTTSCSNFCSRCKAHCPPRHRRHTAQPAAATPAATAVRRSRHF